MPKTAGLQKELMMVYIRFVVPKVCETLRGNSKDFLRASFKSKLMSTTTLLFPVLNGKEYFKH